MWKDLKEVKRLIINLIVLLSVLTNVTAQQKPYYTQYIFNPFVFNPAVAGIERYTDVKFGYRSQWHDVEGRPRTANISVNLPLGDVFISDHGTTFQGDRKRPYARRFPHKHMASEPHHGIGMFLQNDRAGPFNRTDMQISYAYHLLLSDYLNLAAGMSGGIAQVILNTDELMFENPADPALARYRERKLSPDLGIGVWLYNNRFFAGASALQLIGNPLGFSDNASGSFALRHPNIFLISGYKWTIDRDVSAIPSVMVKYAPATPLSVDVNLKLRFLDVFWLGSGYRNQETVSVLSGFNIRQFLNLSYAYDFGIKGLGAIRHGSHEVCVAVMLNHRYRMGVPRLIL